MLPQVCKRCRKLKAATLGQWVKRKSRCHDKSWVCDACLSKPEVARLKRPSQPESPPEKRVREALSATGLSWKQEYPLEKFIYDFACPKLRLLVEIDSWTYHHTRQQRSRDQAKDLLAKKLQWELVRLKPQEKMEQVLLLQVLKKRQQLGV